MRARQALIDTAPPRRRDDAGYVEAETGHQHAGKPRHDLSVMPVGHHQSKSLGREEKQR
jgi:hypothetical protein